MVKELERLHHLSGNHYELLREIAQRLEKGNKTFGQEMPLDGSYDEQDALEEALDCSIYLANRLIYIKKTKVIKHLLKKGTNGIKD